MGHRSPQVTSGQVYLDALPDSAWRVASTVNRVLLRHPDDLAGADG
jgi:hypothetical protein